MDHETPSDQPDNSAPNTEAEDTDTGAPVPNFETTRPTTRPIDEKTERQDPVPIIREMYSGITQMMDQFSTVLDRLDARERKLAQELQRAPEGEEGSTWFRHFMEALRISQVNKHGERAASREGSHWVQEIEHEGRKLRPGQPRQSLPTGSVVSADEIATYLTKKAGVGTAFDIPLYHSGFWIRVSSPSLAALTAFEEEAAQQLVNLGSNTKGMALSNTSQTLLSSCIDFCLQHVVEAGIHYDTPSDLKPHISLLDADLVLWGVAVTMFPNGYAYSHPCIADPKECQHITTETLNLNNLLRTDTISLSQKQRRLMTRKFSSRTTQEELKAYRDDAVIGDNRVVWIGDVGLELRVPNLQEYEDTGRKWINDIIEMTHGVFNEPPHGRNRNDFITKLGLATSARQYAHWVNALYDRDEDGEMIEITSEPSVIESVLTNVLSSDELINDFLTAVANYQDDCQLAMIAIESFDCPKCDTPAAREFKERFPHLVPLDVLSTFFTLATLKLT